MHYEFREELERIQDDKLREFVVNAMLKAPEFYQNLKEQLINPTKKTVRLVEKMLEVVDADDYSHDIVISAVLLQDLTRFFIDDEDNLAEWLEHPLTVRANLMPLVGMIGMEKFDDIMRTIESSHGLNSVIPQVMPSVSDPVFMWILPFANELSKETAYND